MFWHGSTNLFRLFYAGEIQNLNCRRLELATYFFLTRGSDLQEKAKLLLYGTTNSEAQTPTYVEVLPSFTRCRWMNTRTARQEYATLINFCTLYSELHTGSALMFCCLLAACSYMESTSVLVADGDVTPAVSPTTTRRRARPKYVWSAESPTKRLCPPRSVYILARLPNKHNHHRGYILKTRAWPLP